MSYRIIQLPQQNPSSTLDWVKWAREEGLLMAVADCDVERCQHCYGSVGHGFTLCQNCEQYGTLDGWTVRHVLDAVVPITYSPDDGLESLLHQYKKSPPGRERRSFGSALGSVVYEFIERHLECLTSVGGIDVATIVPPTKPRSFGPLRYAIEERVDVGWPFPWRFDLLENHTGRRPPRGVLQPDLYTLTSDLDLAGMTVLLADDTWTSGSTMVSAASLLRDAGAARVVGLPIGRQVRSGTYGTSQDLYDTAHHQRWRLGRCVLCP